MDARTYRAYVDRATANVGRTGPWWWATAAALAAVVGFGIYAYAVQVRQGHSVTGVSHTVFWGTYVANFVFFIGISYGGAITSAILRLTHAKWRAPISRIAEGTALVTLLIGAASVLVDVGRPDRILYLFRFPQPGSPITWDWIAISTYLVGTVIFFLLPLIPDVATYRDEAQPGGPLGRLYRLLSFGWRGIATQERALMRGIAVMAVLIIPLAVSVHSVLAWLFALTVQPGWHSTIFAPLFVLGAMTSGVAAVILVVTLARAAYGLHEFITDKHIRSLSYLLVALDAAYLYFMFSEYLTEGYMQEDPIGQVLRQFFAGAYASWFWPFVIGGLVLPVLLVIAPVRALATRAAVASGLVIAAMWVKRFLIVIMPGVAQGLAPAQVYRVSWVEIAITVGLLAAIPLGLMILFALFPVMSVHEIEEVEGIERAAARRPLAKKLLTDAAPPAPRRQWRRGLVAATAVLGIVIVDLAVGGGPARIADALLGARVSLQAPPGSGGGTHNAAPASSGAPAPDAAPSTPATSAGGSLAVEPNEDAATGYLVRARIAKPDGKPAGRVQVSFYEVVRLLGAREMLIGTATTDGWGVAKISYLPSGAGKHELLARTAEGAEMPVTEVRSSFDATVAETTTYTHERLPLSSFSEGLPTAGAVVLFAIFALFAYAFVGTAFQVAHASRADA